MKFIRQSVKLMLIIFFLLSGAAHSIKYHWRYEAKNTCDSYESTLIDGINLYITERLLPTGIPQNFLGAGPPNVYLLNFIKKIGSKIYNKPEHNFSSALIVGLIYLNKYKTILRKKGVYLDESKIHLRFAVALRLADKFLTDVSVRDSHFAAVIGLAPKEFKRLEREFLQEVDYNLFVKKETFETAKKLILLCAQKSQL